MDKVKAIKVLKPLVDSYVDYANITMKEEDDNIVEALEMAIEALKALDVPDMNVGDMISRQMAIDLFPDDDLEYDTIGGYVAPHLARQMICELPSVQPDHNADVSKKVSISCGRENDVISRKAAIEALARMMPRSYTPDGSHPADEEIFRAQEVFADCIEALEILPPAAPSTAHTTETTAETTAPSTDDWIPCNERLPEENGQYLITIKYKHVNNSYEDIYAEHGEWLDGKWDMFCFGHCGEVEDIIAWMPLPEPTYKEEHGGDK